MRRVSSEGKQGGEDTREVWWEERETCEDEREPFEVRQIMKEEEKQEVMNREMKQKGKNG